MTRPTSSSIGWIAALMVLLIWAGWFVVLRLGVGQTLTIYDMAAGWAPVRLESKDIPASRPPLAALERGG